MARPGIRRGLVGLAIMIGVGVGFGLQKTGPSGPAALARIEPLPWVAMSADEADGEDANSLFHRGMTHYAGQDRAAAIALLERALAAGETTPDWPERDRANLFLGLCHLLESEAELAVAPLEEAARSTIPGLADRGRWLLAQARLVRGEAEAARVLLEALAGESPGYSAVAAEQLGELEELQGSEGSEGSDDR